MDEFSAHSELKQLWKLENRNTILETQDAYVAKHLARIREQGGGKWDSGVAATYIENLRASI